MALLPPLNHAAHARTFQCLLYLDRRSGEELHRRPSPLLHFWVSPAVTYQLANLAEDSAITFRGRTSERHARFDRGSRGDREEGRKEGRKALSLFLWQSAPVVRRLRRERRSDEREEGRAAVATCDRREEREREGKSGEKRSACKSAAQLFSSGGAALVLN